MKILVSGATRTIERLAAGRYRQHLGHLLQPNQGNAVASLARTGLPIAADNAAFSGFDEGRFLAMVERVKPFAPLWVVVPDLVGDCRGTISMFDHYVDSLDRAGADNVPLAIVGQDGMEDCDCDWWMGFAAAFFIGGSTEWKLSAAAADLASAAKARGPQVHMGRVNTLRRIRYAASIGCDSIDGSGFSKFPDSTLPQALAEVVHAECVRTLF